MIEVRGAKKGDSEQIGQLFRRELQREPNQTTIASYLTDYPSAVAFDDEDGELVGFAYCCQFAPDVLELANILVDPNNQSRGVGSRLIERIVAAALEDERFAGIIACNSSLYPPMRIPFRSGKVFYERNGFRELFATPDTRVYFRSL